eukprot:2644040-Rhodomonas_salina.1
MCIRDRPCRLAVRPFEGDNAPAQSDHTPRPRTPGFKDMLTPVSLSHLTLRSFPSQSPSRLPFPAF